MLKIAICDDDKLIIKEIKKIITNYLQDYDIQHEIYSYENGLKLWEEYQNKNKFDLIILDIHMNEMDGISLGKEIRKNFALEDNQIIYISSQNIAIDQLLEMRIFDFIPKNDKFKDKIKHALKNYIDIKNFNKELLEVVDCNKEKVKMHLSEIIYLKAERKIIILTTNKETYMENEEKYVESEKKYKIRTTLKDLEEKLPKIKFVRISNSIIVNADKIKKKKYTSLTMIDGEILSISKKYQVSLREYFKKR